ncbi:hypothetical protein COL30_29690 [Bacillus pseudomycoides]|uniref:Uncharacterized protein n=1 Tax=Bacillus pseudomycoides TaxID=64104 RepID=A0A2B5QVX2_9BACI|nr:hypothetical protein CON79_29120 [Bacillus pseudomycoides]PEA80486.1 hypothetical protein CON99_28130 [Bacillus pseudomycoides]PED05741.1 hypothetical protein COO19_24920 [Bacillus pseudomycoides]PED70207.1 hypothetical protein CON97_20765 [Bacillus pseudomycoides]PEI35488.1 hypothetical protein CN620_25340 [Bacillus pseudomycoides]
MKRYHEDFCTIRREFIIHGFMDRNKSMYHVNAKEAWNKWGDLWIIEKHTNPSMFLCFTKFHIMYKK